MNRYYETDEEQEANKKGHKDVQNNRRDYDHDNYSDEPEDVAYWHGRKDEESLQRIREEERQIEADREQREFERQKQQEEEHQVEEEELQQLEIRQEEQEFEGLMENEENDMQSQDDERPITEEGLFNDILRDEREDNDN
jgi:hypothetical protein